MLYPKFNHTLFKLCEEADLLIQSLCSDPKNLELNTLKSELKKLDYKIKLIGEILRLRFNISFAFRKTF